MLRGILSYQVSGEAMIEVVVWGLVPRCGMALAYRSRMSAGRILVSTGSEFESAVGYSRAVRVGRHIAVAGTTGSGDDIVAQTRNALHRIEIALEQAGATLSDVVRTRIYLTDISRWRDVGAVHSDVFGAIRPAATMVEVSALMEPGLLVEIEADAYVDPESPIGANVPSGPGR